MAEPASAFVKERSPAPRGSIPDLLDTFERELQFYEAIAPVVGVRVPAVYEVTRGEGHSRLVLERLPDTGPADPVTVATLLREMHDRWTSTAEARWPWLRRAGDRPDAAAALIGDLYDRTWASIRERSDVTSTVRRLGDSLLGRICGLELAEARSDQRTLVHGDASLRNTTVDAAGGVVFFDWEDVRIAAGEVDLVWLLTSSVDPERWDEVIAAYRPDVRRLADAVPAHVGQAILSMADTEAASPAAAGWLARIQTAAAWM